MGLIDQYLSRLCFGSFDQQIPYPTNMAFNHSTKSYQIPTFRLKFAQKIKVPQYALRMDEWQVPEDGGFCEVHLEGENHNRKVSAKFMAAVLANLIADKEQPRKSRPIWRKDLEKCLKFLQQGRDYEVYGEEQQTKLVTKKKETQTRSIIKKKEPQAKSVINKEHVNKKLEEAVSQYIADQKQMEWFFNILGSQPHIPSHQEVDVAKFVTEMKSWEDAASIMAAQPYLTGERDDGDDSDIVTHVTFGEAFEAVL